MQRALEPTQNGPHATEQNPRVGCVIVQKGRIVEEGYQGKRAQKFLKYRMPVVKGSNNRIKSSHKVLNSIAQTILAHTVNSDAVNVNSQTKYIQQASNDNYVEPDKQVDYLSPSGYSGKIFESGALLTGAMLENQLINELMIYTPPKFFGRKSRTIIDANGINNSAEQMELEFVETNSLSKDLKVTAKPVYNTINSRRA